MTLAVVLPFWFDRPALEAIDIARAAERLEYGELWVGEMVTFDAFALAGAIARETERISIVVGPLPVSVRDPVSLALGVSSVSTLGGRPAHLALGASTPVVVSQWHGRPWRDLVPTMEATVAEVRALFAGERSSGGFRLRTGPVAAEIAVAAFGPRMLRLAGAVADRVVMNLVTPAQVGKVRTELGTDGPPIVVWLPAALNAGAATMDQLRRQLRAYVGAPGYRDMFAAAGFDTEEVSEKLVAAVSAIGDEPTVRRRIDEYLDAGADTVALVPATAEDPGGLRLLEALAF